MMEEKITNINTRFQMVLSLFLSYIGNIAFDIKIVNEMDSDSRHFLESEYITQTSLQNGFSSKTCCDRKLTNMYARDSTDIRAGRISGLCEIQTHPSPCSIWAVQSLAAV